jgi:hypothetical protein
MLYNSNDQINMSLFQKKKKKKNQPNLVYSLLSSDHFTNSTISTLIYFWGKIKNSKSFFVQCPKAHK